MPVFIVLVFAQIQIHIIIKFVCIYRERLSTKPLRCLWYWIQGGGNLQHHMKVNTEYDISVHMSLKSVLASSGVTVCLESGGSCRRIVKNKGWSDRNRNANSK